MIHSRGASHFYRTAISLTMSVFIMLFACFFISSAVSAQSDAYGVGNYGDCDFDVGCDTAIPPITLSNGIEVSINLVNGQTIPASGYTIVITQLEGPEGVNIESADISIDNVFVETILPNELGTIEWAWDPIRHPGTEISILVRATDDTTSTHNYTVKQTSAVISRGDDQSPSTGGSSTENDDESSKGGSGVFSVPLEAFKSVVPENIKEVFRSLPAETINTFPYILIVVLGLVTVVSLLQIKREVSASETLKNAITQEKTMIELKENFVGLASHYLRTPLTLIGAGVDVMTSMKTASESTLSQLKNIVIQIGEHIESSAAGDRSHIQQPKDPSLTPTIVRVSIALTIIVAAVIALVFNLLAYASGRELPTLNLITQAGGFLLIGLVLYQVGRRLILHRDERKRHDYDLALQKYLQDIQDSFLERTVTDLTTDYNNMRKLSSSIPMSPTSKPLHEGLARIYSVIYKCSIAKSLKGVHSKQSPVSMNAKAVFDYSDGDISEQISNKRVSISGPADEPINIKEPDMVKYVMKSLIDNAVAYSPEGSEVKLEARKEGSDVILSVEDKGSGIPKEKQDLLFQPFSKVEGYEQFNHEGMGFNLFLDKLIMSYLGGTIDIKSTEGQGTQAKISIPA